jgi:hypothetical protein
MYVRKPVARNGLYVVEVCESARPFSKVIESISSRDRSAAWSTYRYIMKETGKTYGGSEWDVAPIGLSRTSLYEEDEA